jgi:hypothetical protein
MYLRLPPSSRLRLMTAWPVVPEPAKKSRTTSPLDESVARACPQLRRMAVAA